MKNFSKIVVLVFILVALVYGAIKITDKPDNVLRVVVIPADDEVSTRELFQPFVDYLQDRMDVEIELITASDYTAVVEAMKYGHADIARFGPANYVMAAKEANIEPLVAGIKAETGVAGYWAYIISKPELEDLNGATFAFVDPASASGFLYPNDYIEKSGISLGRIMFAGSHPAVIEAIKNGSVDAGAVASNRWEYALQEDVIKEGDLKIFWSSELIPNSPWAVRSDMSNSLKDAFTNAMLEIPEDIALGLGINEFEFVKVTDSDYDLVREVEGK